MIFTISKRGSDNNILSYEWDTCILEGRFFSNKVGSCLVAYDWVMTFVLANA